MKARKGQILPVLMALVLIVSAALGSACTVLTRPDENNSEPLNSSAATESARTTAAESAPSPAGTEKTAAETTEKDLIAEIMVDGRRLGDMSKEEKEAHATVPAQLIVNGEVVEVMPPEGIKNLAEQEIFLRNMQARVPKLIPGAAAHETSVNEESLVVTVPSQQAESSRAELPERSLERCGALVLREGADQIILLLGEEQIKRLNELLEPALSGQAVKREESDYDSRLIFPGKGELLFRNQELMAAQKTPGEFFLQKDGETYSLSAESGLRENFSALLKDFCSDPESLLTEVRREGSPRKVYAWAAFSALPKAQGARLAIANTSEKDMNFSGNYFLYRYNGKKFVPLEFAAPAWQGAAISPLFPQETREFELNFEKDYGKLERGLYCLRVSLTSDDLSQVQDIQQYFVLP